MKEAIPIPLAEDGAAQRKRLKQQPKGSATSAESDSRHDYLESLMGQTPTVAGGNGGAGRRQRKKLRFRKVCNFEGCNFDAHICGHEQRGRPKLKEEKTRKLRPYLPHSLFDFLKQSDIQLADVLEAVLDSPAMRCWRAHAYFQPMGRSDEEGNPIPWTAFDELALRGRQVDRWNMHSSEKDRDWLKNLSDNIGPRFQERVTPALLARVRAIGNAGDKNRHSCKYTDTRFCAYCVQYYTDCLAIVRGNAAYWKVATTREEAALVRNVATRCFRCKDD